MAGKITTQLVIDAVNKTKEAFAKVGRDLDGLKQTALSAGKIIAGAIGVDAFAGMVRGAAQAVGEMSRLAQLSNTTATTFQKWSVAAKSVGIEGDKLGDIFKDVQEKFGEFAATGGGGAKDFFEQIAPKVGLTAEQFKNLSGPDALQLYVRGLEKANLTQDQMIFYLESLASDSSLLLPLLRDSGAQLEEMGTQAERLGRILDEQTTQNIKAFNAALKNLDGASDGFAKQATGVIGKLDTMTGASNTAAGSIDRISRGLNKVSTAKAPGWLDRFISVFKLLSAAPVLDAAWGGDAYKKTAESATEASEEIVDAAAAVEEANLRLAKLTAERSEAMKGEYKRLTEFAKERLAELGRAERDAASDLEKVRADRLAIEQRYQQAIAGLPGGADPSYNTAQDLKIKARQALASGDIATAKASAQAALKIIQDLAAAGENTYGFEGFIKELQSVELAANGIEQTSAEEKLRAIQVELEKTKTYAEQLKKIDVKTELDAEAVAATQTQLEQLAQQLGATMRIPVVPVVAGTLEPIAQNTNEVSGYAAGGYIRGPGTGTSDSILARLSNGEFVMRAAAVKHYGPALLAAMNGMQLPKFADGGLVSSLQPAAPSSLGTLNFNLPGGESFGVTVVGDQWADLHKAALKYGRTTRR